MVCKTTPSTQNKVIKNSAAHIQENNSSYTAMPTAR
jgi:hypothetical protein